MSLIAAFVCFAAGSNSQERSIEIPAPRHPDLAVQEEYDAAVAKGKKSAYTLSSKDIPNFALHDKCES